MDNHRPLCRFFNRGFCRNGDACRFGHAKPNGGARSTESVCIFYQQGHCRYGDSCRFRHVEPSPLNNQVEEEKKKEEEGGEEEESESKDKMEGFSEHYISSMLRRFREMSKEELAEDSEQRMRNCGFNDYEAEQLLCQGVKFYDPDAHIVLAALNNEKYEHYTGYDSEKDNDGVFQRWDDEDDLIWGQDADEDNKMHALGNSTADAAAENSTGDDY